MKASDKTQAKTSQWVERMLNRPALLQKKSHFLLGPRQTGILQTPNLIPFRLKHLKRLFSVNLNLFRVSPACLAAGRDFVASNCLFSLTPYVLNSSTPEYCGQ